MAVDDEAAMVTMTTYKRADGEAIYGDYTFMCGDEWATDDSDPVVVRKEVWVRQSVEDYVAGSHTDLWCNNCGEDVRPLTVEDLTGDWPKELCAECEADPEVEKV